MVSRQTSAWRKIWTQIWGVLVSVKADQQFLKESSLLLLSYGIITVLGLVRTPIIVWVIPKEQVGMLGVVASWMPFLQLASLTGLDTASYHYTSKGQPWSFAINLQHRLRWSLLSTAGFFIVAIFYFVQKENSLGWLFIIAGVSYPFTVGLSAAGGMLGAQERYKALFWYRIWESLTDFTGFIPLLFSAIWVSQIVTFYGANQFATLIMMVGYSAWLFIPLYREKQNRLSQQDQRDLLSYGKHQTVINGLIVLNNRIDALLVGIFLPFATMADYSIALLIFEQLKRLWNIYITVRYPKLVKMRSHQIKRQFVLEGKLVFLSYVAGSVFIVAACYFLIPLILPPSYANSLGVIVLLIIAFLVNIPAWMVDTFFRTQQDHKHQYAMRLTGVVVGSVSSLILLPVWGAYGVAGGRILAGVAQSIFGSLVFARYHLFKDTQNG
jgi:O-antigen/teichoic acid export membrane protein